jgi:glyoxylase-like metal-dependent hydrolase (beta-lactamase superfamily II)
LIDHPRGKALFDSGMHPQCGIDPRGRLGPIADLFRPDLGPDDDVAARLRALAVDPAEIRFVIVSHLHFDHTGGNQLLPAAELIVQSSEWAAGRDDDLIARNGYDPQDYDLGHATRLVDGEHDVFGDGSVVCLPTPGHTPGHQSLRVRAAGVDTVLTADACYLRRNLDEMRLPPIAYDEKEMLVSLRRLGALRAAGARLVFGHDPEDWRNVPQAPAPVV